MPSLQIIKRFRGFAQELQAEINEELTETLNSHESHDLVPP
jgi:hypothetical protein